MTEQAETPNPIEQVKVEDLFKKDADALTEEDLDKVVDFYRAERKKFAEIEALGGPKKAKKKPAADPMEVKTGAV